MSATLIWITCAAIVASLGVWLAAVAVACRNAGGQPVASRQHGEIVPDESAVLLTKRNSSPVGL